MDAPLVILYGSQTGNAQDVAERLAREAQLLLFRPRVMAMDAYDVTQLPQERLLLCVASTTGQGDPPDNMRRFWRFLLRKSLPPDSLAHLRFAVFGLGDSGYPAFNVTAKKLARRLEALGARAVLGVGLGDDQHPSGYEAALDTWAAGVWPAMRQEAGPLPDGIESPVLTAATVMQLGKPKYQVTLLPPQTTPPEQRQQQQQQQQQQGLVQCDSWAAAVGAGVAFKRVAAAAAGGALEPSQPPEPAQTHSVNGNGTNGTNGGVSQVPYGPSRPFFAQIHVNRRITEASHFQDTRHMEIDLEGSGITYDPGDVLALLPRPADPAVDSLLRRLGLDGGQWVRVTPSQDCPGGGQAAAAVQCEATVRQLVQGALDVSGASPRRYFFQVLASFASSDLERERLMYFASAEGRDELYRYCKREGRTVLDVLHDFKSCTLPLEWLLETCPPLLPRLFSISSSQRLHPSQAHITVALVEYKTPYNRIKRGLCSSYLTTQMPSSETGACAKQNGQSLAPDGSAAVQPATADVVPVAGSSRVACWLEHGSMRMPKDLSLPLILIGPGTGVAPFRSFLQERLALLHERQRQQPHDTPSDSSSAPSIAPCYLFFGCRSRDLDYYYREEWRAMREAGVIAQEPAGLDVAFSRDQTSKVYVTHKLREHGAALWGVLQRGGVVYVSGSAKKMPAAVALAFKDIVQEHGGLGKDQAAKYVRQLELTGRYFVEAWS